MGLNPARVRHPTRTGIETTPVFKPAFICVKGLVCLGGVLEMWLVRVCAYGVHMWRLLS